MTKPNSTLIAVVLDRSGSMRPIANDTIGGFNAFLAEQKKATVDEARLTLVQFDHEYLVVHNNKLLADVPELTGETYVPRGNTALLDALGRTIATTGEALAKMPENERPEQVVVVVITDGEENHSTEFSKEQVVEMVKVQTDTFNWQFVFLGANLDAIHAGGSVGIGAANAMQFQASAAGMGAMYQAVSSNVADYRSSRKKSSLHFTSAQRQDNADPNVKVVTPSAVQAAIDAKTPSSDSSPKN